jgi:glycerol uptake facilitator-like aquaporin
MGEQLAGGNVAVALLANSLATAGGLYVLILGLGPISGAHMNPAVTLAEAVSRRLPWVDVPGYIVAQITGAIIGTWIAHAMFALPILQVSTKARTGPSQWLAEAVATFGLIMCIRLVSRASPAATAGAVAAYIGAAYWFTASTSFANPAVTFARSISDTFAGIAPSGIAAFVIAQLVGAALALAACRALAPDR